MITDRDLTITRLIDAPPANVYRCWTEPELVKQWFAPLPYTTPSAEMDVRPGGASIITMRSPDGVDMPNPGVFLEVVPNRKIVVTDAYTSAWEPSPKPFLTIILTFEEEAGKTRYTALARHWTVADREAHEQMGFHTGWGICTDQLAALASRL
ncbi:MAG: SRPBCC family protein [Bryobacterales bacterium]|nr:SRPBCC family protein [Bryobacterales bacterium]